MNRILKNDLISIYRQGVRQAVRSYKQENNGIFCQNTKKY